MAVTERQHIPGYWRDETGGELASAVAAYLNGDRLTLRGIALMRAYVKQWILASAWDENPFRDDVGLHRLATLRADAGRIRSQDDIDKWLALAVEQGFDPL